MKDKNRKNMPDKTLSILARTGLYSCVFVTGAAVMVIELLGTRLIAPFYGASLYVWSSLISVAMIALSIGYFIGGRCADKTNKIGVSLIIAVAGLLTLLIPWVTRPVLLATDPLGLRAGAFVSALVLFSPSLTLLGMVGPYVIKMSTLRLDGVGTSAGSVYAVSTLGSVVGTLSLGFFLFPLVGSREILVGVSFLLMFLAMVMSIYEKKNFGLSTAILPCFLILSIGIGLLPQIASAGKAFKGGKQFQILSERESLYGWVRVIDQKNKNLRVLTSDASTIGAASISDGKSRLSYQNIVHLIPTFKPNMKRALLIGLGAGHMATVLGDRYGIVTDTLEIDPEIADAATKYFAFEPTGQSLVGDARYEIRKLKGPYDVIIHDCFTGGSEPSHLLTVETLTQLRGLLSDGGVLAINFVAFADKGKNPALASVARTLRQVFPHQSVFVSEPGKDFNDFIFLASNSPIQLDSELLRTDQIQWLKSRIFLVDESKGFILTDNLNPLEQLQARKAEHYRQTLIEWFGADLLIR